MLLYPHFLNPLSQITQHSGASCTDYPSAHLVQDDRELKQKKTLATMCKTVYSGSVLNLNACFFLKQVCVLFRFERRMNLNPQMNLS